MAGTMSIDNSVHQTSTALLVENLTDICVAIDDLSATYDPQDPRQVERLDALQAEWRATYAALAWRACPSDEVRA